MDKIIVAPHQITDYDLDIQEVGHNGAEEYIRKDALLEWALWYKEEINKEPNSECFAARGAKAAIDDLVDKLNSL